MNHSRCIWSWPLALVLSISGSCELPSGVSQETVELTEACPRLELFEDEVSMRRALPRLYQQHHRDLIVLGNAVYLSGCSRDHLGGASEQSRVGSAAESSRLGSGGEQSRLGSGGEQSRMASVGENSRLASGGEQSRLDSEGEASRLASEGEQSRLDSEAEASRLASEREQSRLDSEGEASRVGSTGEGSRLGSAGESSRVNSGATQLLCGRCQNGVGYLLNTPVHRSVRIYDGVQLWRLVDGQLVP